MNPEQFSALYDETARDLLAYLLRRAQNAEDAADCLAETFLIAWGKREQVPLGIERARPWLFGVARNVLRRDRALTTRASAAVTELASKLQKAESPGPTNDDPVMVALSQLAPLDREIIELLAWDQLTPREVAEVLGLSPNVVRIRAHRARVKLREELRQVDPVHRNAR